MSTPTPSCVTRYGRGWRYQVRSLDDVRALLLWSARLDSEPRRLAAVKACLWWLSDRDAEMRDREAGCVALLREAAVLVGQQTRQAGRQQPRAGQVVS